MYVRMRARARVCVCVCPGPYIHTYVHTHAFLAGVKVQRSDHGANELQHKKSSDPYVEAKIYTEEDQGKARRRRGCKQDFLVLADLEVQGYWLSG